MRRALLFFMALAACATAWSQYVFMYSNPYSAGAVQVGTDINLGVFADGACFTEAEPGETVYFGFSPYSGYRFSGIRYENLSSEDVTELDGGIYSFTMPEGIVQIWIDWEVIPVVVTGVDINEENFPDANFRNWLLSQSYGADAVITDAEMRTITKITARACGIEDLTGIQFFSQLTELDVSNLPGMHPEENWNRITTIDMSGNPKLRKLYCNYNLVSSINVADNVDLTVLDCSDNPLAQIDVTNNTALQNLICAHDQLAVLDVTGNPNLGILECSGNQLTELDLSGNPLLNQLYCDNNLLTEIDVTNKNKLIILNCNNNQLTALSLAGCTELFQLYYYNNRIKAQAMEDMVNSLEVPPYGGYMVVVDLDSGIEQNEITTAQVAIARAKTWSVESISGEEDFAPYDGIEPPVEFLKGDVNGDNTVNIADVTALIDYILTGDASEINLAASDVNSDNAVNIADVTTMIDFILTGTW